MQMETIRMAKHLREVFSGKPWYGHPLRELLTGIDADTANRDHATGAHSIWELVLHIELWARIALEATQSVPMPRLYGTEKDWLTVDRAGESAWKEAQEALFLTVERLARAIEEFGDARLPETVPGREYDFAYLFDGVVEHSVYHFGQIALLKAGAREHDL
jgi:uncharacterized damage-inducible protein DinB